MIKAIFFDIDGTLISKNQKQISDCVIQAFKQLQNKGIKLFIASGRHYLEMEELGINRQFTFDGYLTINGGYCFDQNGVIHKNPIDLNDVKKIVAYTNQKQLACSFVQSDDLYINLINDYVIKAQAAINTSLPPVKDTNLALVNDIYQIDPFVGSDEINKIMALTKHCKYTKWHDGAYDIIPKIGGKKEAIKAIIDYYGININETMAFGDGHNDLEMLEYVGIGVCMANGHEDTKAVSDYICDSVENDGIVEALRHFKLLG